MRLNLSPKPRNAGEPAERKQRTSKLRRVLGIAVWLLLAAGLWLMQSLSRGSSSIVHIPIIYGEIPGEIGLEGEQPAYLDVSVSAKGAQLLYRWMKGVQPISLPMPQRVPQKGLILFSNAFLMQQARESLGNAIQIREVYPDQISLRAFPLQKKEVSVVSHISASARDGYMVLPLTITPTTIELYGSREALATVQRVHTKGITYDNVSQDMLVKVPLEIIPNVYLSPDSVQLQINVVELTEKRVELPVVPIHTPAGFVAKILPARVSLILTMPISDYDKPIGDELSVVADLRPVQEALQSGETLPEMISVAIQGIPDWVVRAKVSPKAVQYILEAM